MANNQNSQNPLSVPTGNDASCKLGRRAIHIQIDFSLGSIYSLDMSQIQSLGAFDCAQTLYVDNSVNTESLEIQCGLTLQKIIVPPGAQAYMPILQPNPPVLQITNVGGSGTPTIDIQILNFFVPPFMWFTAGMPIVDLTLQPLISNNALNVNVTPVTLTGPTDGSGTITAGGTRQSLFAANATRKRFIISNPSTATEVLQFSYGTNTAGLISLNAGQTWDENDSGVSGDQIWIVAATTGHAFTAYSWG